MQFGFGAWVGPAGVWAVVSVGPLDVAVVVCLWILSSLASTGFWDFISWGGATAQHYLDFPF